MENNIKNTVSSIDDATLKIKTAEIMRALGIEPASLGARFDDPALLRAAIMNINERDIQSIISMLGKEKTEMILRTLGGK